MNKFLPKKNYSFAAFKFIILVSFAAFLLPGKVLGQAPTISYSSPHIYALNVAIAPLAPASSNVAAPTGAYGIATLLGTGMSFEVNGVAVDAAGNMYVNDAGTGGGEVIYKVAADGSSTTVIGSGFVPQSGDVAVDEAGNVYVTDQSHVWKIPASGSPVSYGTPVMFNTPLRSPFGITCDAAGNLYVTDLAGGVYKMASDGSNAVRIDSGLGEPAAVALDAVGNVYSTDFNTGALYEIPANGGPQVQLATGFSSPRGLALDAAGTIYVDDEGHSGIYTVPAGGGTPVALIPGLNNLVGLAIDANYNLYGLLQGTGGVSKFSPTGGYFISPALPPGLSIDPTSGIISGTPTAAFGPTAYTVTAFNAFGGDVDTVTISAGPPPVISYGASQIYTAGTAITPLAPSASGASVTIPAYNTALTTVLSGFGSPSGVAMDAAGNIYVADEYNNDIIKTPPGGGTPTIITANLNDPMGIAVDGSGNIYVADSQNGVVKEISADLSTITTVGTGFIEPVNVALDPTGNLFIGDDGSGSIYEIEKATGKQSVFVGYFFEDMAGLATDAAGNVYATDEGTGSLYKFTARSNLALTFGAMFDFPTGVTVDASGDIFVSDGIAAQVYEIPGGNSAPVAIGSGFSFPEDVVADGSGNVYVSDAGTEALYEVSPTGGYYLNQALPRGLKLNDTTGVISGTPKVVSAAANYTITAYAGGVAGTGTVNIAVNAAQPPAISYSSSGTFLAGTAIAALSPADSGGPVASIGYSDNLVPLGSGFSNPAGVAVDSHGNIYVADNLNNQVKKIPAGGGAPIPIGGSFSAPAAVAVDSTGNVYVADEGNQQIVEIPAAGGSNVILGSGFVAPNGVAVDPSGNVFVTDESAVEAVYEIPAGNAPVVTLASGFIQLTGIAVDASDNIYIVDGGNGTVSGAVYKYPLSTETLSPIGFDYPTGIAVDAVGNVYVADQGPNVVYRLPIDGSGEFTVISELNNPQGIAIDPYGNLYIADTDNNAVEELSPDGGYFINRPLPAGLSMSSITGTLSGTPTATSPATNYIVSAYNTGGVSQAALSITVNLPPPPVISYVTPQVFVQNTAISPVSPTSVGVATRAYLPTATPIGSGFSFPYGTTVDNSGNLYVADPSTTFISEILAGGTQTTVGTGLSTPIAVAVDKFGNVYAADQGDNTIVRIQAHTGVQTVISSGYHSISAVAVDSAGILYVADVQGASGVVYKKYPGQIKQLFRGGFSYPDGIAIDAAGNVYVSDGGSGPPSRVYEISPDGSTETHLHHSFSEASGVAIDATGNLFISDAGDGNIIEYPAGGSSSVTIRAGLITPFGPSVDGAGNLYVGDVALGKVFALKPAGGYFINRVLPTGLTFDATTGAISGTPTVTSPATNYTVTGYNFGGGAAATVNIKVVPTGDSNLSGLLPSNGTLSPVFAPGAITYNIAVGNGLTTMTVTPTADDPSATITVQGQPVTTGTPSQYLTLATGVNNVPVVVTSADHSTTTTYTLNIKEAKSQNANLTALKGSSGTLIPGFTAGGSTYTENVDYGTATMSVIPTAANANATITVNGTIVASGSPSPAYDLTAGGSTVITIIVTAQLGNTKTYTVTVNRALSSDASLSGLQISAGILVPGFEPLTLLDTYGAKVNSSVTAIEVTPTATSPYIQGITVNTATVSSGSPSGPITLSSLTTPITIVVTAQDGTQRTYTVTMTRVINDASLSNLQVDVGTFTPKFQPLTLLNTYSANEANGISSVNVTATTTDPGATITINTNTAISGQAFPVATSTGTNPATILVTASDGSTKRTYNLTINVAAPPSDNTVYQAVGVEKPADSPTLANDGITVHQAISPNGDGINDFLQIDNISQYPDNKLSIMNRNGQLIYEAKGYDNSSKMFDGHSNKNGQMQLPGTYFYSLDYAVNGIIKHKTGFIVLKY